MDLFSTGGGYRTALAMDVRFLGRIPFDPQMVECADAGKSYIEEYPDSKITEAYDKIVENIMKSRPTRTSDNTS
jgi:MinD-like ATPase involved in chromosome partitioning or flagellar assembly